MSKKISRTLIIAFFLTVIIITNHISMILLSMFGCFMLGFVISAIVSKEQNNLLFWASSKGIPVDLKDKEEHHERPKRKSDGKDKQKA